MIEQIKLELEDSVQFKTNLVIEEIKPSTSNKEIFIYVIEDIV